MRGRHWYLAGAVCGIAAAAGILAARVAATAAPVVPEEEPQLREPETVFIAMVGVPGGDSLRAAGTAILTGEDDHGRDDAMIRRSEVGERVLVPQEWTDADVELLARLLWSSPLRNEDLKRQLIWVVLNRVDDERLMFPATIAENVNRREFTFYDKRAYLSETNLRIAREELERWTRVLSGIEERPVPEGYVYLRFYGDNNRMIYLMKEPGGEAL